VRAPQTPRRDRSDPGWLSATALACLQDDCVEEREDPEGHPSWHRERLQNEVTSQGWDPLSDPSLIAASSAIRARFVLWVAADFSRMTMGLRPPPASGPRSTLPRTQLAARSVLPELHPAPRGQVTRAEDIQKGPSFWL
jgi:hypothetical protein